MNSGMNVNPSRAVCLIALDELHHSITIFHNVAVRQGMQLIARQLKVKAGLGSVRSTSQNPLKVTRCWDVLSLMHMNVTWMYEKRAQNSGSREVLHLHKPSHGNRLEPPFVGPV